MVIELFLAYHAMPRRKQDCKASYICRSSGSPQRHPRHALGTWRAGAPETIRTSELCRRSFHAGQNRAISGPLPLRAVSSIEDGQAPVAQLDRALPSEGKGRTFESSRARHIFQELNFLTLKPDLLRVAPVSTLCDLPSQNADANAISVSAIRSLSREIEIEKSRIPATESLPK